MAEARAWLRAAGLAAALSCAAPAPGDARDSRGDFAVKGAGLAECSRFLRDLEADSSDILIYAGWLQGYFTAQNQNRPGTFDLVPWQDSAWQFAQLRRYCSVNPEHRFVRAAAALVSYLEPFRLSERARLLSIETANGRAAIFDETLRRAQTKLAEAGHLSAEPSGGWTAETEQALKAYQTARALEPTGLPDQPTLTLLLLGE